MVAGVLAAVFAMAGWRIGPSYLLVFVGLVCFWLSDLHFLLTNADGTYTPGSLFDAGWPVAAAARRGCVATPASLRRPPPGSGKSLADAGADVLRRRHRLAAALGQLPPHKHARSGAGSVRAEGGRRDSLGTQMRDVLVRALLERGASLREQNGDTAVFAKATAGQLGLTDEQVDEVSRCAELHDVGNVAVPDSILHKPGQLTAAEWKTIKLHTIDGERILAATPALAPVGRLVRATHEKWDGAGYPDGLAGEAIPIGARIVTVCDAFNAMISDRPYRRRMSDEDAFAELKRCSGTQFDSRVVEPFFQMMADRQVASEILAA